MPPIVLREIERAVARSSRRELLLVIREQPEVALDRSPADVLRDQPGFRDRVTNARAGFVV